MMKKGKYSTLIVITVLIGVLLISGCSLPFTTAGTAATQPPAATPIFVTPTSVTGATGPTVIVITAVPQTLSTETPANAVTPTPTVPAITATVTGTLSPYLGTHTVQSGESLYSIGRAYGVDPVAIANENGIPHPYTIYRGDVLDIPPVRWSSIPSGPIAAQQFTPNWDTVGDYNYVIVQPYFPSSH
jgi:LysM repeat protein